MIRWRLLVAEAAVLLMAARLLVARVRFARWRGLLGQQVDGPGPGEVQPDDRELAKAVDRATLRLPGESKCLPRAMALHWMLAKRHREAQLVIAVRPDADRGGVEDLHAWVECGEEILIGELDQPFRPLVRFGH